MSLGMDRVLLSDIWKFKTKEDINIFYDIIKKSQKEVMIQGNDSKIKGFRGTWQAKFFS